MIGVEEVPALLVVGLCLRELRGVRVGLELALVQLRQDLRAVLGLLVPLPAAQGAGGGAEARPGVVPAGVDQGNGAGEQREGFEGPGEPIK